jgi:hypothetical protein
MTRRRLPEIAALSRPKTSDPTYQQKSREIEPDPAKNQNNTHRSIKLSI